jgi:hypothetical protein
MPMWKPFVAVAASLFMLSYAPFSSAKGGEMTRTSEAPVYYRTIDIDGVSVFYREAGPKDAPTLLLLHGFPSSSRMFNPVRAARASLSPDRAGLPGVRQ